MELRDHAKWLEAQLAVQWRMMRDGLAGCRVTADRDRMDVAAIRREMHEEMERLEMRVMRAEHALEAVLLKTSEEICVEREREASAFSEAAASVLAAMRQAGTVVVKDDYASEDVAEAVTMEEGCMSGEGKVEGASMRGESPSDVPSDCTGKELEERMISRWGIPEGLDGPILTGIKFMEYEWRRDHQEWQRETWFRENRARQYWLEQEARRVKSVQRKRRKERNKLGRRQEMA